MTTPATRRIEFKLHHNLLNHLIERQAATPEKALLELVMNAADAEATIVGIALSSTGFTIKDNGRGFQSEDEIEAFFATFGTPQEREKTYGRYRVGRAQIFGWANTVWRSNQFQMRVDLSDDGAGFQLEELDQVVSGCEIAGTWNDRAAGLNATSPRLLEHYLRDALHFPPVRVVINGEVVGKPAAEQRWTSETSDAYFRLTTHGELRLYNQGVFVTEYEFAKFHVGGVILTKDAIELTMARNEPLPYGSWVRIAQHLREQADQLHGAGVSVGTAEFRSYALSKALAGNGGSDVESITTIPKRYISLDQFTKQLRNTRMLAYATRGNLARVERALESWDSSCAKLHFDTLEQLRTILNVFIDATDEEIVSSFLDALNAIQDVPLPRILIYDVDSLPDEDTTGTVLEWDELDYRQRLFLNAVRPALDSLAERLGQEPRELEIARMGGAVEGFTDGFEYVAISHELVSDALAQKKGAIAKLLHVYVHELCHHEDSRNAAHDDVFYRTFHEYLLEHADAIEQAYVRLARELHVLSPAAKQSVNLVNYVAVAGWNPVPLASGHASTSDQFLRQVYKTVRQMDEGHMGPEEFIEKTRNLAETANAWDWRQLADQIADARAIPLRLAGPIATLRRLFPFERQPCRRWLSTYLAAPWSEFGISHSYESASASECTVTFTGHKVGRLQVRPTGVRWTPYRYAKFDGHRLFEEAARTATLDFPWEERRFDRDIAWFLISALTTGLWRDGPELYHLRRSQYVRARRKSDPPATMIMATCNPRTYHDAVDVTEEWSRAFFTSHPDWMPLDGDQLLEEGLSAFDAQAMAIDGPLAEQLFWARWTGLD